MKKINMLVGIAAIVIAAILMANTDTTIYATSAKKAVVSTTGIDYITVLSHETLRTDPVKIQGEYPYFSGDTQNAFTLNNEVQKIVDSLEKTAKKEKAVNLTYYFETIESAYGEANYVSVLLYSSTVMGSTLDKIDTFVYDGDTMEVLTLSDILGINSVKLANQAVSEELRTHPEKYLSTFAGIGGDQDFYVEDGIVYLAFDKYEIAPGSEGTQLIPIYMDNVTNLELTREEYQVSQEYNIRIVPLRTVGEAFGFDIRGYLPEVVIQDSGTGKSISIKVGENRYRGFDDRASQTLEVAPEIRDGITYVPISFVETILNLSYHIDSSGTITISQYLIP